MKSGVLIKVSLLSLILISSLSLQTVHDSSPVGLFVATSPCDAVSRPLLQISAAAHCEMIKWSLTLYCDPKTLAPTRYKLDYIYGLPKQGTNLLSGGETRVEREGKWTIGRGTKANPDAVVYQLDSDKPQRSIYFQKLDYDLVHLLDADKRLAIGNSGWSYTLNDTSNSGRKMREPTPPKAARFQLTSPAISTSLTGSIKERFVGRSPCHEVARELNRAVNADCIKVKWDLTLHRDPNTLTPTSYTLNGTFFRERVREGKWTIGRGTKANPNAVVYELESDKPQDSLFFLKEDDNILLFLDKDRNLLVGNEDFSYTLNRANMILEK